MDSIRSALGLDTRIPTKPTPEDERQVVRARLDKQEARLWAIDAHVDAQRTGLDSISANVEHLRRHR